ncbi:MAG TPA: calcium-binding protein [Burkholderiales bacterium]|nr:calcium-binding protein [Burkholderiales bacterium]
MTKRNKGLLADAGVTLIGTPDNDTLVGTAGDDRIEGRRGHDHIEGLGGNDLLLGGAHYDVLMGGNGKDTLEGGGYSDELDGGAGADVMRGGDGSDHYYVDHINDQCIEGAGDDGSDTIITSVTVTMGAGIENLYMDPPDGDADIDVFGNNLANDIYGNNGSNHIVGGGGDDHIQGNNSDGPGGNDLIEGGTGNDEMNTAHGGNSTVIGGKGNDHYIVGANDIVIEQAGEGTDYLEVYNFDRSVYELVAHVEETSVNAVEGQAVQITGTNDGDIVVLNTEGAVGSALYGLDGDDSLHINPNGYNYNGDGNSIVDGGDGNDTLSIWNGGTIYGGNGNDEIWGYAFSEEMHGGNGNDKFSLYGTDLVYGDAGSDTFQIDSVDGGFATLADFNANQDSIGFIWMSDGVAAENFVSGSSAVALEADDHIIFDTDTGALYYDSDGAGGWDAWQIASVNITAGTLDYTDFVEWG